MKYLTSVVPLDDGRIISTLKLDYEIAYENIRDIILRQVLDTNEEQVRQALIKLGWTPPAPSNPVARP